MKKPVIMAVGGAIGGVAVAAALFMFVFGGGGSAESAVPVAEPTPVEFHGSLGPHLIFEERVYSLAGTPEQPRYLKLGFTVEFETTDPRWAEHSAAGGGGHTAGEPDPLLVEFEAEIGTGRLLIEDAVTRVVSAKSLADLASSAGRDALREEVREAIAHEIEEPRVTRVLFTTFITQ